MNDACSKPSDICVITKYKYRYFVAIIVYIFHVKNLTMCELIVFPVLEIRNTYSDLEKVLCKIKALLLLERTGKSDEN